MGFEAPGNTFYLTSVRIHGGRYGYPKPPAEDFHVSLCECDKDFKLIADFPFSYSKGGVRSQEHSFYLLSS